VSLPPTFKPLFLCIQGTGTNQRIGNKIRYKSIRVQYWINYNNTNTIPADQLRFLLIYDSQPNGAVPALTDVVQNYTSASATSVDTQSSLNVNNTDRFRVLMDEKVLFPNLVFSGGNPAVNFDYSNNDSTGKFMTDRFIDLKELPAQFNAANGDAITDFTKGSLVYCFYNQTNAAGSYDINLTARVRFYDV